MSAGVVTKHLVSMIAKQVDDNGIVVWYDPDNTYAETAVALSLPDTSIFRYDGSFVRVRWEIDQERLMDGNEAPRLVVYVPMAQEETHHALVELETAGVTMQPGQQPPVRNTRLAVLAKNALKGIIGDETASQVEKQTEAGKLTLSDLDALADKGGEISKGVIALVFGTGNAQEVALSFLDCDRFDEEISKKDAKGELVELFRHKFDFNPPGESGIEDLRRRLARHVLMTDFVSGLSKTALPELAAVSVASKPSSIAACGAVARAWRLRRDTRVSYVTVAREVEQEFNLSALTLDPQFVENVDTFPLIEKVLLAGAEKSLLTEGNYEILTVARTRLSRFWCDVDPQLQSSWALVASVAEVLLEADRVEQALKKTAASLSDVIEFYTEGTNPWCVLDTYHRHMETRWYNFEPHRDDHDNLEKLVVKARQRYSEVGSEIARCFLTRLQKNGADKSIIDQREIFEKFVKPLLDKEKVAYVWVDALRFEMGRELARVLGEDFEIDLKVARAAVPTVTEIGMAALLPHAQEGAKVVAAGGSKLALEIKGAIIKDRKDRIAFLKKSVDVATFDTKLESLLPKPSKKIREGIADARLVLVTSQEIDELCEQDNISQARRQMDGVLNDLRRGIRALLDSHVQCIVLTADHGHLFGEELSEDMKVDPPGGETVDLNRRMWVGYGGSADDAFLRAPLTTFNMEGDFDLATPWTLACFKSKGGARAYFHGGLSPQEMLVPVMTIIPLARPAAGPPTGILWALIPGSQKLTTRFFSVQITGSNKGLFDIAPPKVHVELRAKGKVISRAVSASYGFDESTGDVALRNDVGDTKNVAPNTVTLMIIDEPDQKNIGLYLLDAATGAELARLEKIEVSIAM